MHLLAVSRKSLLVLSGVVVLGIIDVCHAADVTKISSTGCVDKAGFEKCLADAVDAEAACIKTTSGDASLIVGCGYGNQINQMNCYMSSCWNKIYSCEYSALAAQYTTDRDLMTPEPIPFWPAPANAPGACSCNIGEAVVNSTQVYLESIGCISTYQNVPDLFGCTCCSFDGALSALYAICPNNNPDYLGYADYYKAIKDYESQLNLGTCAEAISGSNCVSKWGIDPPAGGKFLDPDSLSKSFGNDALSTVSGTLTAPPGGPTITWSILGVEWTVTAASAVAGSGGSDTAAAQTTVVTTTNSMGETVNSSFLTDYR
ncbi:hypothetical protein P167DRAFT_542403 [Morchella conica CCBAS932]|uniref:Uncharacterized protein n=1 Tax=Morchella conica CCBAS932 TaxID=1392247 RepID=A0A3N4L683_9PEZI|nr:hypothetical protein P167DRAFT_542403 [Morchella conica CCBAS932]